MSVIHTTDAVSQVSELLGVIQHFDALGVGVVADCERPGDGGCEFPADAETSMLKVMVKSWHICASKKTKNQCLT